MKPLEFDHKDLVIISVTLMALVYVFIGEKPKGVIMAIITGLFGVAVGRLHKGGNNDS